MKRLGIHAFVWTGSSLEADLEAATIKAKDAGYSLIEFPRLDPTKFGVDSFARRLRDLEMGVVVTMGLPWDADISSEDDATVKRGEALLNDTVAVARDLGATKLGGIIFSAHGKYAALPTRKNWDNSVGVLSRVAGHARAAGVT